jgi:hypothetical protein
MARCTGIECAPDSCVMVAARAVSAGTEVSAYHVAAPGEWPAHDSAITAALQEVRRRERLPRRAAVVMWGLPDSPSPREPATRAAVRPIEDAGFSVEAILTPPQALAALAATRPRPEGEGPVCWLALNRHGAAIAIVHDGSLLFGRSFDWIYQPNLTASKAQLLQRYSLVAHLAPEVQRAFAVVRDSHGLAVTTAVTCGDLPELRSLTMPLIEELDIEVETLDSTDGLVAVKRAREAGFDEAAPALRIPAAAATAPRRRQSGLSAPLRAAAAALVIATAGWLVYREWPARPGDPGPALQVDGRPAAPGTSPEAQGPPQATPPVALATAPPEPAPRHETAGPPPVDVRTAPTTGTTPAPAPTPSGRQEPVSTRPPLPAADSQKPGTPATTRPVQEPPSAPTPTVEQKTAPAQTPASAAQKSPPAGRKTMPTATSRPGREDPPPLAEPLPRVDSILVDRTRRLAIVNGAILRVGDAVGSRRIVRIDADAIVLREPSGREVVVRLGSEALELRSIALNKGASRGDRSPPCG